MQTRFKHLETLASLGGSEREERGKSRVPTVFYSLPDKLL